MRKLEHFDIEAITAEPFFLEEEISPDGASLSKKRAAQELSYDPRSEHKIHEDSLAKLRQAKANQGVLLWMEANGLSAASPEHISSYKRRLAKHYQKRNAWSQVFHRFQGTLGGVLVTVCMLLGLFLLGEFMVSDLFGLSLTRLTPLFRFLALFGMIACSIMFYWLAFCLRVKPIEWKTVSLREYASVVERTGTQDVPEIILERILRMKDHFAPDYPQGKPFKVEIEYLTGDGGFTELTGPLGKVGQAIESLTFDPLAYVTVYPKGYNGAGVRNCIGVWDGDQVIF